MPQSQTRYEHAKRVTVVSALVNLVLGFFKVVIGSVGHSQALLADGIHSFSDVLTDGLVLFAAKAGGHGPDNDHPYGHARIETMASLALAFVLLVVGLGIAFEAVTHMMNRQNLIPPTSAVIIMALVSAIANEVLYRVTLKVSNVIDSQLLRANAWHNRTDALSSFVVLFGVIGAKFGFGFLDNIAAIFVAIIIAKMGVSMAWISIKELVDTGLNDDLIKKIKADIMAVPGVCAVHQLRTRSLAGAVFTDVHVQVSPNLTVSEGHYISDRVYKRLLAGDFGISDVLVHIDPEDDEQSELSEQLPNRDDILAALLPYWHGLPGYSDKLRCNFHYLSGKIAIELFLPLTVLEGDVKVRDLVQRYRVVLDKIPYLARVDLCFS